MKVTSEAAQGSVLNSEFWNVYDSLLRSEMPDESKLVGYGDDAAALTDRWTAYLIKNVGVIQWYFQSYLNTMGKLRSPDSIHCKKVVDAACHSFFVRHVGEPSPLDGMVSNFSGHHN